MWKKKTEGMSAGSRECGGIEAKKAIASTAWRNVSGSELSAVWVKHSSASLQDI